MRIGVLTHNYPRFRGDFVGGFIEASCRELARQGHHVTAIAPYDPAFDRPLSESVGSGRVDLRLYHYVWPERLHRVGYGRSMRSDLALRFDGYVLSPAMIASGIITTLRWARHATPDVLHAHWVLPNGFIGAVVSRLTGDSARRVRARIRRSAREGQCPLRPNGACRVSAGQPHHGQQRRFERRGRRSGS